MVSLKSLPFTVYGLQSNADLTDLHGLLFNSENIEKDKKN